VKIVVYTSIIGNYDKLVDPKVIPDNVDFICFSDDNHKSDIWKIRKVEFHSDENSRTSRKYKILPHRYLPEYDVSIWVDGNKTIVGDITEYCNYLGDKNLAVFDHMQCKDKRCCIYEEANAIINMGKRFRKYKDHPHIIEAQMDRYRKCGYPENNGLVFSCGMIRNHNNPQVINLMEDWWSELESGSKRDQLSFNYVCWKNGFKYNHLPGDGRNDGIITHRQHTSK
jgi:hypothetical protein